MIKNTKFTKTIDAADENLLKTKNAIKNAITDTITLDITTALKLLNNLIEVNAGKIIKLEINNEPITLIPTTTTIAVAKANIIL